ncbi:MAG: hypothetical protein AAFY28_03885 [Actinomycetota bacterium]
MSTHRIRTQATRSVVAAALAGVAMFATLETADAAGDNEPEPALTEQTATPSTDLDDLDYEYLCNGCSITTRALTDAAAKPIQSSVMADFSSRGVNPAAPDIIKPDVTAPGTYLVTGHTPTPSSE